MLYGCIGLGSRTAQVFRVIFGTLKCPPSNEECLSVWIDGLLPEEIWRSRHAKKNVDRKSDGAVKAAAVVVRLSSVRLVVVWPLCTPALYVDRCNI